MPMKLSYMGLVYHDDDVWLFVEDMNKQSEPLWGVFPMPHHRFTRTTLAFPPSYSIHLGWYYNNKACCLESSCSG